MYKQHKKQGKLFVVLTFIVFYILGGHWCIISSSFVLSLNFYFNFLLLEKFFDLLDLVYCKLP